MIVRSSISNSNDRLPTGNWGLSWIIVCILFSAFILFFEVRIRQNGWQPSYSDSVELWSYNRKRASELGDKALILIGSSRIQLGLDLYEIQNTTDLVPVQLAIDGTSPVPVLENLANDPDINGTIILSVAENDIQTNYAEDQSIQWINYYRDNYANRNNIEAYRIIDDYIKLLLSGLMVTRLENAMPYTIISRLAFERTQYGNYILTHQNRSRDADYTKVKMPDFYAIRVARHLGMQSLSQDQDFGELLRHYQNFINNIKPLDNQDFIYGVETLLELINKIEIRGGEVIIVRLPSSKLVWEADKRRYPRESFWNLIANRHVDSIHFEDYPGLQDFELPDGSHIDVRDKTRFTKELIAIINSL